MGERKITQSRLVWKHKFVSSQFAWEKLIELAVEVFKNLLKYDKQVTIIRVL